MRLMSFQHADGDWRLGAHKGAGVVDLTAAGLPTQMLDLVLLGEAGLVQARAAIEAAPADGSLPLEAIVIGAPFRTLRRNMFCVGKNYSRHAEEFFNSGFDGSSNGPIPKNPIIFSKGQNTIIASGSRIPAYLDPTGSTDYEGELGVVIGREGRSIARDTALSHVYGYTIVNDVTARELQKLHGQWFIGKNIDGFCPMGPMLVTADEFTPAADVKLRTYVNQELRQDGRLAELIFDIPTLIATLSATMTLLPGDLIATGTPDGVGIGFVPPKYLRKGDVVRIAIDGLGELVNEVA